MKEMYVVTHEYNTENMDFESVSYSDLVACFENFQDAEAFCKKWDKDHKYYENDIYSFYCGELIIQEIKFVSHTEFNVENNPSFYGYKCNKVKIDDWK